MLRMINSREEELRVMQRQSDSLSDYRERLRQWIECDMEDAEVVI